MCVDYIQIYIALWCIVFPRMSDWSMHIRSRKGLDALVHILVSCQRQIAAADRMLVLAVSRDCYETCAKCASYKNSTDAQNGNLIAILPPLLCVQ